MKSQSRAQCPLYPQGIHLPVAYQLAESQESTHYSVGDVVLQGALLME